MQGSEHSHIIFRSKKSTFKHSSVRDQVPNVVPGLRVLLLAVKLPITIYNLDLEKTWSAGSA